MGAVKAAQSAQPFFESVRRVGSHSMQKRANHGECAEGARMHRAQDALPRLRQKADGCLSVALKAANHTHGMFGSDCSSIGVALHGDGLLRGQSGWPSDASARGPVVKGHAVPSPAKPR